MRRGRAQRREHDGMTALDGVRMGTRPGEPIARRAVRRNSKARALRQCRNSSTSIWPQRPSGISNDVRDLEGSNDPARPSRLTISSIVSGSTSDAGSGTGRARCLRVPRGDWRELGFATRPYRGEVDRLGAKLDATVNQARVLRIMPTVASPSSLSRPTRN